MTKNNLPPARGFGNSAEDDPPNNELIYCKCLVCGMVLADDMPRGLVIEHSEVKGIQCISCAEADEDSIQIGSPKNPVVYDQEEGKLQ